MAMNMRTFTQALAKTAAVIEKTVQTTVQEVTGPKPLQDYELLHQIGSAGPALAWKLYSAKARGGASLSQQYPVVCVWVLDKRSLSEARTRAGLSKAAEDAFFNVIRQDATRLVRMRHPGVVHVVQGLDENKNAMAMVTEPLFSSISNALGNVENISDIPKELKGIEMGLLEVKHGLLQLAETLDFLHQNARLVHRALSPESVLITATGAWKLGGFGFAISTDQASGGLTNEQAFHYAEFDTEDSMLPLQPSLNYTAPELVRSKASSGGCLSDIFSLGCLAYHLIARKPLLDCHNNVKMYMNSLNYLTSEAFSSIPSELVSDLQRMLSVNESSRPTATDFTGSPFFRNDTRLRALRFLDHMLERDNMQKSDFLKALSDMWKDFDSRVLRYKVLPPLCAELRNLVMQPMILPMVLTIAEAQEKNDFELSTLPALLPVLSSASGDTLLLLVKHAELIIDKTSHVYLISHVLPMLVRAYDDNDPRLQEEVLKKSFSLAKHLDPQLVKQAIVPRVHSLALRTTVAAVRVNALICLGDLVQSLDKPAVLDVLQTIQRCTAVDRSPPTLMCTLRVSNSILKRYGTEFAAEHVLPLVTPLLTAQQLNVQQFAKYMHFIKDILRRLEEKRGVSITDSGVKEVGTFTAGGLPVGSSKMSDTVSASSAAKTSGASWDEDWNIPPPMRGASASVQPSTTSLPSLIKANEDNRMMDGISTKSNSFVTSSPALTSNSSSQTISSSMGEFEWPPRAPSVSQQGFNSNGSNDHNSTADPFGDWNSPTRTGSVNGLSGASNDSFAGLMMNKGGSTLSSSSLANDMNFQSYNGGTWGSNSQSLGDSSAISNLGSYGGNIGAQSSVGFFQQNQGVSGSGGEQKATDLGSIFSTSKSSHGALKLAPPPSNAVGRGRGRGRGGLGGQGQNPHRGSVGTSLSSGKPPSSEQPPLLDLL